MTDQTNAMPTAAPAAAARSTEPAKPAEYNPSPKLFKPAVDADAMNKAIAEAETHFAGAPLSETATEAEIEAFNAKLAGKIAYNFPVADGIPQGFDLFMVPISERRKVDEESKLVLTNIVFAAIPSLDIIRALPDNKGEVYIQDAVLRAMQTKIANAARPKDDGSIGNLPLTVEDFLENRRESGLEAWTKLGKDMVTYLTQAPRNVKPLDVRSLRRILMSKAEAEELFPKVKQENWVKVLNALKTKATALKLDVAVFDNWLATRDQAGKVVVDVTDAAFEGFEA